MVSLGCCGKPQPPSIPAALVLLPFDVHHRRVGSRHEGIPFTENRACRLHTALRSIFVVINGENLLVCFIDKEFQVVHAIVLGIQVALGKPNNDIFMVLLQNVCAVPSVGDRVS